MGSGLGGGGLDHAAPRMRDRCQQWRARSASACAGSAIGRWFEAVGLGFHVAVVHAVGGEQQAGAAGHGRCRGQPARPACPGCWSAGGCEAGPRSRSIAAAVRKVALVRREAQGEVGVQRIQPAILQRVGAQLVRQADAAALLGQIQHCPGTLGGDAADGAAKLGAAIAAQAAEQVAGEALGMHPDQRLGGRPPAGRSGRHNARRPCRVSGRRSGGHRPHPPAAPPPRSRAAGRPH